MIADRPQRFGTGSRYPELIGLDVKLIVFGGKHFGTGAVNLHKRPSCYPSIRELTAITFTSTTSPPIH